MQAASKNALKYLKLFFIASFERGNLTEPTARVGQHRMQLCSLSGVLRHTSSCRLLIHRHHRKNSGYGSGKNSKSSVGTC